MEMLKLDENFSTATGCSKKDYVVLTLEDIIGRIDDDINTICSVLHVSRGVARILLTYFYWNIVEVTDAWFDDENPTLIGDHHTNSAKGASKLNCSICFNDYPCMEMRSTWCGHFFCERCYKTYIEAKIGEGHGCLKIICPEPNCDAVVLDDMIERLVSKEFKERFEFYVVRSYVQGKKNVKWCPAPGCDYAVEYELGSEHYDVKCNCSYMFCWNCVGAVHRPVDCETSLAWLSNKDVSADYVWIIGNTKPCPKCKKAIEKNSGCMHMTCPKPCSHHFCWMCLGEWSENHGFHECSKKTIRGWFDGEANSSDPEKFSHAYFSERWALNQRSQDKAQRYLKDWESKNLREVIEKYGKTELELKFITEAWLQIIECRRILKWTYTYAFYMNNENKGKKALFEYLQGEAKASLERLENCAGKDLEEYFNGGGENHAIIVKIIDLTKVANRFFGKLVSALENGLEEVKDSSGCIKLPNKNHADGESSFLDWL